MAYAPILDPSAYPSNEVWRKVSVAAAAVLQELADGDAEQLRLALGWLDEVEHDDLQSKIEGLDGVRKVIERAGVIKDVLVPRLVEQLRQVKAFGELDGDRLDDYIGPVSRLIRSGRVELFAGTDTLHHPKSDLVRRKSVIAPRVHSKPRST